MDHNLVYNDGKTYYGLTGDKYDAASREGKVMEKIDDAFIKFYQADSEFHRSTDFDIGEYIITGRFGRISQSFFSFDTAEAQITYYMLGPGLQNKAKFGAWGNLTKIQGNKSYSAGSINDGVTIKFVRQNTSSPYLVNSAIMVFHSPATAEQYYKKVSGLLFKR